MFHFLSNRARQLFLVERKHLLYQISTYDPQPNLLRLCFASISKGSIVVLDSACSFLFVEFNILCFRLSARQRLKASQAPIMKKIQCETITIQLHCDNPCWDKVIANMLNTIDYWIYWLFRRCFVPALGRRILTSGSYITHVGP